MCNTLESLEYNNHFKETSNNQIKIEHLKHIQDQDECRHLFQINHENEACQIDKLFKPDHKTCWKADYNSEQTNLHNKNVIVYTQGKNFSCQIESNQNPTQHSINNPDYITPNHFSNERVQPLICDGDNTFKQLDIAASQLLQTDWVATGYNHVCAINKIDGIKCWGDATYDQIHIPELVSIHQLFIGNIVAGPYNTCVQFKFNAVACWGRADNGINQIPTEFNAAQHDYTSEDLHQDTPTDIVDEMLNTTVFQISINEHQACGVKIVLNIYPNILSCWGSCGEVCTLPDMFKTSTPPHTHFFSSGLDNNPYDVSVGYDHACTIQDSQLNNGILHCWGNNSHGQTTVPAAFRNNTDIIKAAHKLNCAIKNNFYINCWGVHNQVPSKVYNFTRQISAGGLHSCATMGGSFECWGSNKYGQTDTPLAFSAQRSAVEVKTGWNFNCGIAIDGYMGCWGENHYGQTDQPQANMNWDLKAKMVSVGISHSCGILNSDLRSNQGGVQQMGKSADSTRNTDSKIKDRYDSMIVNKLWKLDVKKGSSTLNLNNYNDNNQINMNNNNSQSFNDIHLEVDNKRLVSSEVVLVCWGGYNESGQRTVPASFKHQVAEVAVGDKHTCATQTTPTATSTSLPRASVLSCWGNNDKGQADVPPPIEQLEVLLLSSGGSHTCSYLNYEQVYYSGSADVQPVTCWGSDVQGQSKMPHNESDGLYINGNQEDDGDINEQVLIKDALKHKQNKKPNIVVSALSAGIVHSCVIAMTVSNSWSTICWGMRYEEDSLGMRNVNPQILSSNWDHDCSADQQGYPICWGNDDGYGKLEHNGGHWSGNV